MYNLENDTLNMNICTYTPKLWTETVEQYISILTVLPVFIVPVSHFIVIHSTAFWFNCKYCNFSLIHQDYVLLHHIHLTTHMTIFSIICK